MSEEKEEVFEEKAVKEEAPVEIKDVERKPEPEVKDIEEVVEEPIKLAPVKKKKRVLTDAQKAQLAENLKKGLLIRSRQNPNTSNRTYGEQRTFRAIESRYYQ